MTFDERNRRELDSIRNLIMKESEAVRLTSEQTYEREAISMKETIITLQTQIKLLNEEINTLQTQNGKLNIELSSKIQNKDHELQELRTSLKMKTFELTSLGILFEERMELLRRKETENNRNVEQINILKAALGKQELESGGRWLSNALTIDEEEAEGVYLDGNNMIAENNLSLSFTPQRAMSSGSENSYVRDDIDELNVQLEKLHAARSELEELQAIIHHDQSGNNVDIRSKELKIDVGGDDTDEGNHEEPHTQVQHKDGLLMMG